MSIYSQHLDRHAANYAALSPVAFVERSAEVFGDLPAVIHGARRYSWGQVRERSARLAAALRALGVGRLDTVSVMLPNTPEMVEAHYAVPALNAVLNTLNTRLDAPLLAWQMAHCEATVLITDREFAPVIAQALQHLRTDHGRNIIVIDVNDSEYTGPGEPVGAHDYEALLAAHVPLARLEGPADEWDAIAVSYTSGTTGDPKGVVTHHRGAYLNALGNVLVWGMKMHPVYLWTLPMFHCNGWCFPWTLSAIVGTHVCLRDVRAAPIWNALADEGVTHLCGAPVVMSLVISAPAPVKRQLARKVQFFTAAAPPPEKLLADMTSAGFEVTHLYGLTETYGPAVVNDWHAAWSDLPPGEQAALKSRQGVRYLPLEQLDVLDPETMTPVPRDGQTMGEVMFRGNVVMKGYLRNPQATQDAFAGGWFHSGDLGVIYPDGYIQLKDRSKDIIISGGENISSIEVEEILYRHRDVQVAAVVSMPHDRWGETPCAFVELSAGTTTDADALRDWCRTHLAGYKVPGRFVLMPIPRTSTGKVQKFMLREQARIMAQAPVEIEGIAAGQNGCVQ